MLDPNGEWTFQRLFQRAAAPAPRLTRRQKKNRRRYLKTVRQMLLHFAGHHYTHVHSAEAIDRHLLEIKFLESSLPISVPRSLRFSLGSTIGGKKVATWAYSMGSVVAGYAAYHAVQEAVGEGLSEEHVEP